MSAYKLLSEYFSDTSSRRATVSLDLEKKIYRVTTFSSEGKTLNTYFESVDDAEDYSEDWVRV